MCLRDLAIQGHAAARFEAEEGLVMVRAGGALRYDWERMAYGLFARAPEMARPPASQNWCAGRWTGLPIRARSRTRAPHGGA